MGYFWAVNKKACLAGAKKMALDFADNHFSLFLLPRIQTDKVNELISGHAEIKNHSLGNGSKNLVCLVYNPLMVKPIDSGLTSGPRPSLNTVLT